jgi:ATPase subunit of ABC transporter with duplicated ATPase domains
MLELTDLRAGYGRTQILNGVNLSMAEGQTLGILGHNGMGKTTLLRLDGLHSGQDRQHPLPWRRHHHDANASARHARHRLCAAGDARSFHNCR